ncbi:MAG: anthrone oxygenase family protein [Pseudomonadota bacterium]
MSNLLFLLVQFSVLAYALVAGVFLAFSDFIMRSLASTEGNGGAEAMQIINREVFRWIFMALFLGMSGVSVFLAGYAWVALEGQEGALVLLAALVYLVGCFGVTIVFNVPMNEAFAGMELNSKGTRSYWFETYLPRWTFWNSVRSGAAALSAALLLFV